jgi:hypothetical protein
MITPLLTGALCVGGSTSGVYFPNGSGNSNGLTENFSTTAFSQLKMFDANNGWALTPSSVLKTTDGGKNWTDVTPLDWEPKATESGTPSSPGVISSIVSADFLDADHAWIVAESQLSQQAISSAETAAANMNATASAATSTPTINASSSSDGSISVFVRSTVDGGKTWMTSNPIVVSNLSEVSQPVFIDEHEGWLELQTFNSSSSYDNLIYHTLDGGITWSIAVPPNPFVPPEKNQLSGINAFPLCEDPTKVTTSENACTGSIDSNVQGCTLNQSFPDTDVFSTFGQQSNATSLDVEEARSDGLLGLNFTSTVNAVGVPGGAPNQGPDSAIIVSPPVLTQSGTSSTSGILPVQMEADPDGNGAGYFFLHLFKLTLSTQGSSATDLSPTSSFAISSVSGQHVLSAVDMNHIYVIGQAYTNGTYGDWNLYEFNGSNWVVIPGHADASIPSTQGTSFIGVSTANLDFISDTEGWATSGSNLYHITIANDTATWSLVNSSTTITRTPGAVVPAPTSAPPCAGSATSTGITDASVAPGNLPMSLFNTLPTVEHTWYSAPNNDPPGYDSYPHAKGTGTYASPITFAIADDSQTFHQGEEIYIPELEKYFYAEDTCAACAQDIADGRPDHIDLWVGDLSSQCADNIKVPSTIYSSSSDPEPVHYLVVSSSDTASQNYTVNTQPFSC